MNWKFYLMMAAAPLEMVSRYLANKDTDDIGTDDKVAHFLHYCATGINAILNDQPLPTIPAALKE